MPVSEERFVIREFVGMDEFHEAAGEPPPPTPGDAQHRLWLTRRQVIIMELGAIEDYLDMPRSIVPRRKREHGCRCEERKAS